MWRSWLRAAVVSSFGLLSFSSSGHLVLIELTSAIEQIVRLARNSRMQREYIPELHRVVSSVMRIMQDKVKLTSSIVKAFDLADICAVSVSSYSPRQRRSRLHIMID